MNLNIVRADLPTCELVSELPVSIRKADSSYWIKADNKETTCPYVDLYGDVKSDSIYHSKGIRPVIYLRNPIEGDRFEKIQYDGSEWYFLSPTMLLAKDTVDTAQRYRFQEGEINDFQIEAYSWYKYQYGTFTSDDVCIENHCCEVPDGVRIIDDDAFYGRSDLFEIHIPDSVERIGNRAFSGCKQLKTVYLGNGLKSGGSEVFLGCKKIKNVYVSDILSIYNYRCDNFGSPLQYGAALYVGNELCTQVEIPVGEKYPWLLYPLIGCGSVNTIAVSSTTPCYGEIVDVINDLNNGGQRFKYFTNGQIRKWELELL